MQRMFRGFSPVSLLITLALLAGTGCQKSNTPAPTTAAAPAQQFAAATEPPRLRRLPAR